MEFFKTIFAIFREDLMKCGESIARPNLISFGTCFGKFTKSNKFRLNVTAIDYLAPYAKVNMQF